MRLWIEVLQTGAMKYWQKCNGAMGRFFEIVEMRLWAEALRLLKRGHGRNFDCQNDAIGRSFDCQNEAIGSNRNYLAILATLPITS